MTTELGPIAYLKDSIAPLSERLKRHPLYREIRSPEHLRIFVQSHVFAVWDFMSLLKSLQGSLTCVSVPWMPTAYPRSRRLLNEIVLGEESDSFQDGYISHFELYLQAMREMGADPSAMEAMMAKLRAGERLTEALWVAPAESALFVRKTFEAIESREPHVVASAFAFGREDLIPTMFLEMVRDLRRDVAGVGLFEYYLARHIEVDGDSHGPMALAMIEELCGDDPRKWDEAAEAAVNALQARLGLWDGILGRIQGRANFS